MAAVAGDMDPDSVSEQFREDVKQYVHAHDELTAMRKAHRDLNKAMKAKMDGLMRRILPVMRGDPNMQRIVLSGGGSLVASTSKRTEALKPDHIVEELRRVVSPEQAHELLENMNRRRTVSEQHVLKRVRARGA